MGRKPKSNHARVSIAKRRAAAGETQNLLRIFETASGDAAAAEPDFLAAPEASSARNAKNTTTVQSETLPREKAKVSADEEPFSDKLSNDKLENMCQTFVCRDCAVEKSIDQVYITIFKNGK